MTRSSARPLGKTLGDARRAADVSANVLCAAAFGMVFVLARTWGAMLAAADRLGIPSRWPS